MVIDERFLSNRSAGGIKEWLLKGNRLKRFFLRKLFGAFYLIVQGKKSVIRKPIIRDSTVVKN